MEAILSKSEVSEKETKFKKRDPVPFVMGFAERIERPVRQTEPLKMLTRTTCGTGDLWDDSDI